MTATPTGDQPQDGEATTNRQQTPSAGLRGEISRGQLLDLDLARDLGHPEPVRSAGAAEYLDTLARRGVLPRRPSVSSYKPPRLVTATHAGS